MLSTRKVAPYLGPNAGGGVPVRGTPAARHQAVAVGGAESESESVQRALGPLLACAQLFGLLPVRGVLAPSAAALRFDARALRTLWAFAVCAALAAVCAASCLHVLQALRSGADGLMRGVGVATAGAVFYGVGAASALLLLRLAPRWPQLLRRWEALERAQAPLLGRPPLRRRAALCAATIFTLSYVEHLFSMLIHVRECLPGGAGRDCDFLRLYVTRSHAFLFSTDGAPAYSPALGAAIVLASELGTFAWNFNDVFVIVMSGALAARLRALNRYVLATELQVRSAGEWAQLRQFFAAASALVKRVDDAVCSVVLLSFLSNLYFICLQLLNGLSPQSTSAVDYVYFFGSFLYLVARTVALTLTAAGVHDEGRLALPVLYQCPPASFCLEAQRLQMQLTSDELSLTGLHFFSITRSFLLAVAGAVVTYEVILLQFNMPSTDRTCACPIDVAATAAFPNSSSSPWPSPSPSPTPTA